MKKKRVFSILIIVLIVFIAGWIIYFNQNHGFFIVSRPYYDETYVTLRFDDGLKSQIKAFEILKKYNFSGSFYIITDKPDSDIEWERDYYLNWEDINEISEFMEIGSHAKGQRDMSRIGDYEEEIAGSKKRLEEKGYNISTFVYPAGNYNRQVLRVVEENYDCASSQDVGNNAPPIRPHLLKSFTIRYGNDMGTVKRVIKKGKWNIITFHDIGDVNYEKAPVIFRRVIDVGRIEEEYFEEIVEYLNKENITIITMDEGCRLLT